MTPNFRQKLVVSRRVSTSVKYVERGEIFARFLVAREQIVLSAARGDSQGAFANRSRGATRQQPPVLDATERTDPALALARERAHAIGGKVGPPREPVARFSNHTRFPGSPFADPSTSLTTPRTCLHEPLVVPHRAAPSGRRRQKSARHVSAPTR